MFVLCPYCQFLVTLDPGGQPPSQCPHCDRMLSEQTAKDVPPLSVSADTGTLDTDTASDDPTITGDIAAADSAVVSGAIANADTATAQTDRAAPATDTAVDDATDGPAAEPADAIVETMLGSVAPEPEAEVAAIPAAPALSPAAVVPEPTPAPEAAPAVVPNAPRRRPKAAPSFIRSGHARVKPSLRRQWLSIGTIAGLTLLLLLQLLLADRARLSGDARWRPALSALCGLLQCTLPPWHDPTAFSLLSRAVRPHPTVPGALRVTATFRNDARWPQPWPSLVLTLSDLDGRTVGARVFGAREYLGAAPTRSELESGQSAVILMDVVEPAPQIVAFTFDFR